MSNIEIVRPTLLGSDGLPLVSVATDRSDLNDPRVMKQTAVDLLIAAGRMLRDGKSLAQMRVELNLVGGHVVDDRTLYNAALRGLAMLNEAIAAGREPAETISTEMREQIDVADEAMVDSTGVRDVTPDYLAE